MKLIYLLECWKYEPNERSSMQKVVSTLKSMIFFDKSDTTIDNKEKENSSIEINSVKNYQLKSNSSKITIDSDDLKLDNISDISQFDIKISESDKSLQDQASDQFNIVD